MKKTTAILFSAALLLCTCFTAKAQDVDGISLWDKITKEQLIEKYGEPVEYDSQEDNEVFNGLLEFLKFNDVWITLSANYVTEFGIHGTKPRAMTKFISGGIGIGDSVDLLKKIENYLTNKTTLEDGGIRYDYVILLDNRFHIVTKDSKIVYIFAVATTT